jgi:hypothetical protein
LTESLLLKKIADATPTRISDILGLLPEVNAADIWLDFSAL